MLNWYFGLTCDLAIQSNNYAFGYSTVGKYRVADTTGTLGIYPA